VLFSSFIFVLVFLPASLLIYFGCSKISSKASLLALLALSSIFYAWGNPVYLLLIFASVLFNYYAAKKIQQNKSKWLIGLVIGANILLLGVFKYTNFFVQNINDLFSVSIAYQNISLPLAISFLTFHQIWFLVGTYKGSGGFPTLLEFANYITFFPHLIAGPIVRHTDYLPQLACPSTYSASMKNLSVGSTIFILGLFKKTVLADPAGTIADHVFGLLSQGVSPNLIEAWMGVFAYSFQIYFDFSGYSDMAIGLARMFNIYLPANFLSPYQSQSIIEFWRRWHISLSTFLKEHLYIPLGGNRKGSVRRYSNLLITMLIGGLWHGASWTFVVWGGLHGMYLAVNHLLRAFRPNPLITNRWIRQAFVFFLVSIAWIFFRAETFSEAMRMLHSMFDPSALALPAQVIDFANHTFGISLALPTAFTFPIRELLEAFLILAVLFCVAFFFPNTYEWMAYFRPAKYFQKSPLAKSNWFKKVCWKPTLAYMVIIFILFTVAFGRIDSQHEFIYFRF
jgi:alginate O-acetyltransferase complex protein AlgI